MIYTYIYKQKADEIGEVWVHKNTTRFTAAVEFSTQQDRQRISNKPRLIENLADCLCSSPRFSSLEFVGLASADVRVDEIAGKRDLHVVVPVDSETKAFHLTQPHDVPLAQL